MRIKVVLPQPDGPISDTNSWAWTARLMLVSATTGVSAVWNVRPRLRISMMTSDGDDLASCPRPRTGRPTTFAVGSVGIGALHHRTQQDVAARTAILAGRVLDLVVADAVLARDEDHARRRHPAHVAGVVAGAADDRHGGHAQFLGARFHRGDAAGVELHRRRIPDLLEVQLQAV